MASGDGTNEKAMIVGDVYIHPSVKVHPTAKVNFFAVSVNLVLPSHVNLEMTRSLKS